MEDNKIPKCGCCHTGENISETDFGYTLSLINGKYKLVIIYWLEQHDNVMRYSELKRCLGNISHKTLSSTLKEMESDGLIIRKEYNKMLKAKGVGAKISYASQNAPNEIREGDRKIIVQTITNMDYWNYIP